MKHMPPALLAAAALHLMLTGWTGAVETVPDQVVTLARHETVAVFHGLNDHRCLGLTSLCPDQCGHSGRMASFGILTYLSHEKLDEFGDPETDTFAFLIDNTLEQLTVPPDLHAAITALQPGARVLLSWDHAFVTVDGASGPERPVTRLEVIAPLGTPAWQEQIDRRAGLRNAADQGPAVGSAPWMEAVGARLGVYDEQGHGPDPDSAEWRQAIQWKAFGIPPDGQAAGHEPETGATSESAE